MRLLIVNGWSASSQLWASFIENLPAGIDAKVIDLDRCRSLESWREVIDSNVDHNTLLMGWSLGGMLAIDYAASTDKHLVGLCTLQTNPSFVLRQGWEHAMSQGAFEQFYSLTERGSQSDLIRQFSHMLVAGSHAYKADKRQLQGLYNELTLAEPQVLRSGLELLRDLDLRRALVKLRLPGLHLFGGGDVLVPPSVSTVVQLLAPRHTVRVIMGMGHLPCLTHQAEIGAQLVSLLTNATRASDRDKS